MGTQISDKAKEIALNKPNLSNGDREKFKEFLQSVEVYMDVNDKVYRTNLIKIIFVLLFINSGPAATWKYQFIDEKMKLPADKNVLFPIDKTQIKSEFNISCVTTSDNYQITACTRVWYWASYQLSTVVYLVLGLI